MFTLPLLRKLALSNISQLYYFLQNDEKAPVSSVGSISGDDDVAYVRRYLTVAQLELYKPKLVCYRGRVLFVEGEQLATLDDELTIALIPPNDFPFLLLPEQTLIEVTRNNVVIPLQQPQEVVEGPKPYGTDLRKQEPSILGKAASLASSLAIWAAAGFKLADTATLEQRLSICNSCQFWKPKAMLGAGKCTKCGCAGVKLKLATSSCPIGKWHAVNNS